MIAKLDSEGGFVGLLPSNVRLGLDHKPHLSQLLAWLATAATAAASAAAPAPEGAGALLPAAGGGGGVAQMF